MALPARRAGAEEARSDPLAEFSDLSEQLSRLFNQRWSDLPSVAAGEGFTPLADVEETDDAYLIDVELPGVNKGDVDIEISDRRLVVSGERKEKERVGLLRRRTRSWGRFHYEITLPDPVDEEHVEAGLSDGVLHLRVPKRESARRRRIPVG
jgi:HSP20 family protein